MRKTRKKSTAKCSWDFSLLTQVHIILHDFADVSESSAHCSGETGPVWKQNARLWVKLLQASDLRKRTRIKHRLALLLNYLARLIYSKTGISYTLKEWHSKSRDFFHQESCVQIHLYNNFMGDQNQTVFAVTRLSSLYIKMELKVSNSGVTTLKTRYRKRLFSYLKNQIT